MISRISKIEFRITWSSCLSFLLLLPCCLVALSCNGNDPAVVEYIGPEITQRDFPLGNSGQTISMVWIESGTFMMGAISGDEDADSCEYPRHQVNIPRGFWIGKYEITLAQWQAVTGRDPSRYGESPNQPVANVSYHSINDTFLLQVNSQEATSPWRLPTEAEWEYACRAGTVSRFSCLDQMVDYYIHYKGPEDATLETGQLLPNALGLHDVHGNVREWCIDSYHETYDGAPTDGGAWVDSYGHGRVLRGGRYKSQLSRCRSSSREWQSPDFGGRYTGFRLVRTEAVDNTAPFEPELFTPVIETNGVLSINLTWSCSDPDGDPLHYDLFFGPISLPPLVVSCITDTTCTLLELEFGTTYYWKVIAYDFPGAMTSSEVENMTTPTPSEHNFTLGSSARNMTMILVQPGDFLMGTAYADQPLETDEYPRHDVNLGYSFWIGKYEVTQSQWEAVTGYNPSHFSGYSDRPVENVSWNEIHEVFLPALNSEETGSPWRLSTEAEWEYVCRAGSETHYPWGEDEGSILINNYSWYGQNSGIHTHDVGTMFPNAWGIHDLLGNTLEWCEDWYHPSYDGAPDDGSVWLEPPGIYRVLRGGGWDSIAVECRSGKRFAAEPSVSSGILGFRLVRAVD